MTRAEFFRVEGRLFVRWALLMFAMFVGAVAVRGDTGLHRVTPTSVKMPLAPGVATEYTVEREAFPGVSFENPAAIVSAPGETNRLYIVERAGRIVLLRDLNNLAKEVFLD